MEEKKSFPTIVQDTSPASATDACHDAGMPQTSADDALKIVEEAGDIAIDDATNKRLLRKIDRWVMPMLCLVYSFNYLDKVTLSYGSVTGISDDLHLKGDNFQWLGSLFYIGYLAFEYPAGRILQRFPLAKYSGLCVLGWGILVACSAATTNFAGIAAVRLLLGIFEASVSPAWVLFTSQWYTKYEHAMRVSWWFGFNGLADSFGSLVAYGIAQNADHVYYAITPWKIIFAVIGSVTFLVGVAFLIIIPDKPNEAWWLSKEDRMLVIQRVRVNQQGVGNHIFKPHQFKEALLDPAVWAFAFMGLLANIPNGGISLFSNLLFVSFGYTDLQSLLYGAITGPVNIAIMVSWAWVSQRYGYRIMNAFWYSIPGILGCALIVTLPNDMLKGRLAGFYLSNFTTPQFAVIVSLVSSNVAGYTKKTTAAAIFFISYCCGNIIGPHTFTQSDAPRYIRAQTVVLACTMLASFDLVFLHWWYQRANKQHEKRRQASEYVKRPNQEFLDLTDRENAEFVYEL